MCLSVGCVCMCVCGGGCVPGVRSGTGPPGRPGSGQRAGGEHTGCRLSGVRHQTHDRSLLAITTVYCQQTPAQVWSLTSSSILITEQNSECPNNRCFGHSPLVYKTWSTTIPIWLLCNWWVADIPFSLSFTDKNTQRETWKLTYRETRIIGWYTELWIEVPLRKQHVLVCV